MMFRYFLLLTSLSIAGVSPNGGYAIAPTVSSSQITTALGYTPFGATSPLPASAGGTGRAATTSGCLYYDSSATKLGCASAASLGLSTASSGSFTATLTGVAGTVTGTFYYVITGQHVSITIPTDITGTTNSTAMTFTGLPAGIQPTRSQPVNCVVYTTATTAPPGQALFSAASGTVTFSASTTFGALLSTTGWAATIVTKGIPAQTFQYNLN